MDLVRELESGFSCLVGADESWDMWVCAGENGFAVQEEGEVVGGECEVENKGAGMMRCDLVALVPFLHKSD